MAFGEGTGKVSLERGRRGTGNRGLKPPPQPGCAFMDSVDFLSSQLGARSVVALQRQNNEDILAKVQVVPIACALLGFHPGFR